MKPLEAHATTSRHRFAKALGGSPRRGKRAQFLADAALLAAVQKRHEAIAVQERVREDRKAFRVRDGVRLKPRRRQKGRWAPWSPGFVIKVQLGTCVTCGRERCYWDPNKANRALARQSKGKAYVG